MAKSILMIHGLEPDPMTRQLLRLYLAESACQLKFSSGLQESISMDIPPDHTLFFVNLDYLIDFDKEYIKKLSESLGSIPVYGLASFMPSSDESYAPLRLSGTLIKPIKPEPLFNLLHAFEHTTSSTHHAKDGGDILSGFLDMIDELEMDGELVQELCLSFTERGEEYLAILLNESNAQNATIVDQTVHSLKSMSGNLGFNKILNLCDQIRNLAKSNKFDEIPEAVSNLGIEFRKAKEAMHAYWPKYF